MWVTGLAQMEQLGQIGSMDELISVVVCRIGMNAEETIDGIVGSEMGERGEIGMDLTSINLARFSCLVKEPIILGKIQVQRIGYGRLEMARR